MKKELQKKGDTDSSMVEEEGREEVRRIKAQAREEGKKAAAQVLVEANAVIEAEQMRLSAAKLQARKLVQDARYALVQEAIEETSKLLKAKTKNRKEYEKLLEKLIKEGIAEVGSKDYVVQVNDSDKQFAKKFGEVETISTMGGAVVVSGDGRMKINNTFEALLEQHSEELKQKAFALLFK